MDEVTGMFQRGADCALSREHGPLRDKGQQSMLHIAHVLLAMVYPPAFHQRITIMSRNASFTLDVAKDGEALSLL